jgi:hypothetical protein
VAVSSVGVPVSYLKPNQKWTNFGIAHTTAIISFAPDKASESKHPKLLSLSFNDVPLKEVITVLEGNYSTKFIILKKQKIEKLQQILQEELLAKILKHCLYSGI